MVVELTELDKEQAKPSGKVILVGAGPGDPGLITVRGLEALRSADVVAYDALIDRRLLDEAPPGAERIDVGKRAKIHKLSQDQTNALLAQKAAQGKAVVRLKGGDPYLFGRGAEEVQHLAQQGIACEVVAGVTAGIAAPMAAGIPVTHRHMASTVTFVTGHEDPTKDQSAIDYAALAGLIQAGGTVCFYMGVGRLPQICDVLTGHGLSSQTPVAIVQWGSTPKQHSLKTDLARAPEDLKTSGVGAPAIIVVGPVAGIEGEGLDFFTHRPMFGQRVVITRTRQQASDLRRLLDDLGALTLEAPTIELEPPDDWTAVDEAIRGVSRYDWLVLTSVNGAAALADRLDALGLDARQLGVGGSGGVKVAAIGDATEAALNNRLSIRADLTPTRFVAESLAAELIAKHGVAGQRMLLLRADIARPALPKLLAEAGAVVEELTVYQTRRLSELDPQVMAALEAGEVDWVTFTSSSTVTNMIELLGPRRDRLKRVRIASIGPITSQTLRTCGLEPTVEAVVSNIAGLVEAMARYEQPAVPV